LFTPLVSVAAGDALRGFALVFVLLFFAAAAAATPSFADTVVSRSAAAPDSRRALIA
jgi:hypothetical protein